MLVCISTGQQYKALAEQPSYDVEGSEVHPAAGPESLLSVQERLGVVEEPVAEIQGKRIKLEDLERAIEINHK